MCGKFQGGKRLLLAGALILCALSGRAAEREYANLRSATEDLCVTFGDAYPGGPAFLLKLDALETGNLPPAAQRKAFEALRQEALLANPLLQDAQLLLVKRRPKNTSADDFLTDEDRQIGVSRGPGREIAFPSNHECNSSLERTGYDNEIDLLSPIGPEGALTTLFRPEEGGYVGEMDLHWDADRLLFTQSHGDNWRIWEIGLDGTGLRQVSQFPPDVDAGDACYLPDGRIVFGCTASYQSVPCWHGRKRVSNLFLMNADGSDVRQLCFDQDHNFHPVVLPDGQVLYHRWDYTGINHIFMRQLMVMNPDGTGQRAVFGSNAWYPNAMYFPRPLPDSPNLLVSILSGYHGVHRMGQLVLADTGRGQATEAALIQRISGRGESIDPQVRDALVNNDWPKFLHPYPLSDKYFLTAAWLGAKSQWAIYLTDVFDNLVLVREEPGYALLEPILVRPRPVPPAIPDRVDLAREDATVYLHDVYAGPGLEGVPRGTIKSLRVLAYHFAYPGMGGPDKAGYGGPWEVMRILGTTPINADGSAFFRVPAKTPIAVQPLDAEGKAVQLMRSWFSAMPGEAVSCVGCHERNAQAVPSVPKSARIQVHRDLDPWYGPARGFDFAREVQPVLDRYCVDCHDGRSGRPDLRPEEAVPDYAGKMLTELGRKRLNDEMAAATHGYEKYAPAYDALIPYLRRVGIEDDVALLLPGEYHADTSPLVQLLQQGHHGVALDPEAWDRIVTWIDLNAPCHGTWGGVFPLPAGVAERRLALRREYGGPTYDPEAVPECPPPLQRALSPHSIARAADVSPAAPALIVAAETRPAEKTLDLGAGVTLRLVRIPAGSISSGGDMQRVPEGLWMGACEVTNAQFRRFAPDHDSRYYTKRHGRADDEGLTLNEDGQPAVRVSWDEAMAFCAWLSERTGIRFTLPDEAQWEFACRAGSERAFSFGKEDTDFAAHANMGDRTFSLGYTPDGLQITGGVQHLVMEGAMLADTRYDDGAKVTAPAGSYLPNAWGLYDMHGNAAEWTASILEPASGAAAERVVRGGSFYDAPRRCTSSFRVSYPSWQRVFNTGFRVVCEDSGNARLAAH